MTSTDPKLNKSQQEAIAYNDGPLLIVAGAGTGKTTTLVEKIKYLINEKLAKPEEILCLTFTEKAATEMEERVDRALPYGYFQMWISTFHSFADEVLRSEINHIGLNPSYKLMTQAQTILFLKKNLFRFELKYFRPLSNPTKFLDGLLQHFSRLRDEDISPEEYSKWALHSLSNSEILPEDKEKNMELAKAYQTYQKLKIENDVCDFDDLIYYLLQLFRTRPNILKQYQKRFKYIMVDEFQDTNIAQYQLIKELCPHDNTPKLTVVGDDSQAIYKFRGASISNIMTFMKDYPSAKQVSLLDNYRSNQLVLDHAYKLIQFNNPDTLEVKLGISKELKSHKPLIKNCVEFEFFNHGDMEADFVAEKILELRKKQKYEFQDFAILVRANSNSDSFIASLKRNGIPFQFLGPGTLFRQAEIKDLIAYLKVLTDLEDTISLYRLLTMPLFKIDSEDITLLISFCKKTSLSLFQSIEIYLSFFNEEWYRSEFQAYRTHLPLLKAESRTALIPIIAMIKRHLALVRREGAAQILFYFLQDTNYFKYLLDQGGELEQKIIQNISRLLTKLQSLENEKEAFTTFDAVDYFNMSLEMGESPLASDNDAVLANAVNILTVHASKGLEFPVVFIPHLVNGRFPTYARRESIPVPDELIKETLPEGDFHVQEERRLFYVGMTRAMDCAYLSAAELYGDGTRKRKISPFVIETMGEEKVLGKQAKKREERLQLSIFDFKPDEIPLVKEQINLTNFSFSQLQTYETCPLQYKYQYILKIPTPPAAAASFGSTIHNVLQRFYEGFLKDNSLDFEHMKALIATHWIPVGYSSQSHATRMKEEAEKMLAQFYKTFHTPALGVQSLEKLFKIKVDEEIYITGKIDRVDTMHDGSIEIIDYKTGKVPEEKELKKSLQLSIYALAATNEGLYNKPIDQVYLTFYYLQDMKKVTMQRTQEELIDVTSTVKNLAVKIKSGTFEPKVGKWCDYCSYKMICEAWK